MSRTLGASGENSDILEEEVFPWGVDRYVNLCLGHARDDLLARAAGWAILVDPLRETLKR